MMQRSSFSLFLIILCVSFSEDDVVVTDEGRSVLSAFAPQSVEDIETLMKKKGIGNQRVGKE
jgi:hypothetical protein